MLVRRPGRAMIYVNAEHHRNRQRFTIAHELAHYCLEHPMQDVHVDHGFRFRDSRSSEGTNPREVEANQFAAALLMPAKLVRRHARELGLPLADWDVEELAERFGVSAVAMQIRLDTLRL